MSSHRHRPSVSQTMTTTVSTRDDDEFIRSPLATPDFRHPADRAAEVIGLSQVLPLVESCIQSNMCRGPRCKDIPAVRASVLAEWSREPLDYMGEEPCSRGDACYIVRRQAMVHGTPVNKSITCIAYGGPCEFETTQCLYCLCDTTSAIWVSANSQFETFVPNVSIQPFAVYQNEPGEFRMECVIPKNTEPQRGMEGVLPCFTPNMLSYSHVTGRISFERMLCQSDFRLRRQPGVYCPGVAATAYRATYDFDAPPLYDFTPNNLAATWDDETYRHTFSPSTTIWMHLFRLRPAVSPLILALYNPSPPKGNDSDESLDTAVDAFVGSTNNPYELTPRLRVSVHLAMTGSHNLDVTLAARQDAVFVARNLTVPVCQTTVPDLSSELLEIVLTQADKSLSIVGSIFGKVTLPQKAPKHISRQVIAAIDQWMAAVRRPKSSSESTMAKTAKLKKEACALLKRIVEFGAIATCMGLYDHCTVSWVNAPAPIEYLLHFDYTQAWRTCDKICERLLGEYISILLSNIPLVFQVDKGTHGPRAWEKSVVARRGLYDTMRQNVMNMWCNGDTIRITDTPPPKINISRRNDAYVHLVASAFTTAYQTYLSSIIEGIYVSGMNTGDDVGELTYTLRRATEPLRQPQILFIERVCRVVAATGAFSFEWLAGLIPQACCTILENFRKAYRETLKFNKARLLQQIRDNEDQRIIALTITYMEKWLEHSSTPLPRQTALLQHNRLATLQLRHDESYIMPETPYSSFWCIACGVEKRVMSEYPRRLGMAIKHGCNGARHCRIDESSMAAATPVAARIDHNGSINYVCSNPRKFQKFAIDSQKRTEHTYRDDASQESVAAQAFLMRHGGIKPLKSCMCKATKDSFNPFVRNITTKMTFGPCVENGVRRTSMFGSLVFHKRKCGTICTKCASGTIVLPAQRSGEHVVCVVCLSSQIVEI